jgi:hypothetical protein
VAQEQATLAQCKGEAATSHVDATRNTFGEQEAAITNARMARNGYIRP